jgi:hypothetical protein
VPFGHVLESSQYAGFFFVHPTAQTTLQLASAAAIRHTVMPPSYDNRWGYVRRLELWEINGEIWHVDKNRSHGGSCGGRGVRVVA